jgi:hypothetical protein
VVILPKPRAFGNIGILRPIAPQARAGEGPISHFPNASACRPSRRWTIQNNSTVLKSQRDRGRKPQRRGRRNRHQREAAPLIQAFAGRRGRSDPRRGITPD